MIKILSGMLAACFILALAMPAGAQDVQLLQNGSFEDWANGEFLAPDHWSNVMADSIFATRERVIARSNYSCNVTWITPTQANAEFLSDPIPVVEGATYSCSLWVFDNDPAGRVTLAFRWNTGNFFTNLYSADSPDWQQLVTSQAAPVGATSLRVFLRCYDTSPWDGNATVYVDDAVLWGQQFQGNAPPSISGVLRYPYPVIYAGDRVTCVGNIMDPDGTIASDSLYKRVFPGSFSAVTHDSIAAGNSYWFTMGTFNAGDSVEYFIAATDDDGARAVSPTRGFTVVGSTPGLATIYSIQHTTNQGSLPNCFPTDSIGLHTVTGLVVGRYEDPSGTYHKRYFLQEQGSAWNSIFVYLSTDTVQVGDSITVTGIVSEYYAETELGSITSQIRHSSGRPLPNPVVVSAANFGPDSCSATAEPYEGMLIQINNLTVIDSAGNGDFWAVSGTDSVCITDDLFRNGANPPTISIGQEYTYIKGIGRYTYGMYRLAPRFSSDVLPFSLECTGGTIFDVQFSGDPGIDTVDCWPSPDSGQMATVCGIVTAVRQGNTPRFFLQDQANTSWGGMYCYDFRLNSGDTIHANVGDYVQINSHVKEYYGWTEFDSVANYILLGSNQTLPDTAVATVSAFAANCDFSTEGYENILVRLNNVTVLSDNGSGQLWITDGSTQDSIRIANDLWYQGADQPNPLPSPGAVYDWIVGVVRWEGRQSTSIDRGWIVLPRFASDYHAAIIPEPTVVKAWSVNSTTLAATFDREMDPVSTENPSHYTTAHGLSITAADLDSTGRRVYLTTATQPNDMVDSLIVVGVCDLGNICITTPSHTLYHSGLTPISLTNYPFGNLDTAATYGHVVTVKGLVEEDTSMTYYNSLFIRDQSGPLYNGVQLFLPAYNPMPHFGDSVIVTGAVGEYYGQTELTDIDVYGNLTITHVGPTPTPVPHQVTVAELNANGEGYEGLLVTVCDTFVVSNVAVDAYGFSIRLYSSPNDSIIVHKQAIHTRYNYVPVQGDMIIGITGIYRYQRNLFRIQPRFDADFNTFNTWCGAPPEGCNYTPGDINGNGTPNGIDVVFGVNYFKGVSNPPTDCHPCCPNTPDPFFAGGDVNGNCTFNGIDITFFVRYLKGQVPTLLYCPTCPPAEVQCPPAAMPPAGHILRPLHTTQGDAQ